MSEQSRMNTVSLPEQYVLVPSPFGFHCSICKEAIADYYGRAHLRRCHGITISLAMFSELQQEIAKLRQSNLAPFLVDPPYLLPWCSRCNATFSFSTNAKRHLRSSKCGATETDISKQMVQKTVCGRVFLVSNIEKQCMEWNQVSSRSQENQPLVKPVNDIVAIISKFIPDDEPPRSYVGLFAPLVGQTESYFERCIVELVNQHTLLPNLPSFEKLLVVAERWLVEYSRVHVQMVPANLRHQVLTFQPTVGGNHQEQSGCFVSRMKNEPVLIELRSLLIFLGNNGQTKFIINQHIREIDNCAPGKMEDMVQSLVPKIVLVFLFEKTSGAIDLPIIWKFAISRCFHQTDNHLTMLKAQQNSSRLSTILHMLRLCLVSYMATMRSPNFERIACDLTERLQVSHVVNMISPAIRTFREVHSAKPSESSHTISPNGDINVDSFVFPLSVWSTLIPRCSNIAYDVLGDIFETEEWKTVLGTKDILVCRQSNYFEIRWGFTGTSTNLMVRPEPNNDALDRLISLVELAFHGLGCGSMRKEELSRVYNNQIQFRNGNFYYYSKSSKKPGVSSQNSNLVEHKLPKIMGRVALLMRIALQKLKQGGDDNSFIWYRLDRNFWMVDMVTELFELSHPPTALQVRHFWTGVTNVVFPNNATALELSALDEVAEMSGHSVATHQNYYNTTVLGGKEYFYEKYHAALGDRNDNDTRRRHVGDLCERILEGTLKIFFGREAKFQSKLQKEFVLNASNCRNRHSALLAGCGSGKSLTWNVSTYTRIASGVYAGTAMVVLPYKFLVGHHYAATCKLFGFHSSVVARIQLNEISQEKIPTLLKPNNNNEMPALIYLTIDALSRLINWHIGHLIELSKEGYLVKIFLDEVHTVMEEMKFRRVYECLTRVAAIGTPIIAMTGTMPTPIFGDVNRFLGLSKGVQFEDMHLFEGNDVIGSGFGLECINSPNLIQSAISDLTQQNAQCGGAAHVICATKIIAETINESLLSKGLSVKLVTGDSGTEDTEKAAIEWKSGLFEILVGTTATLVGNENQNCRLVLIVGILYSPSQIVQGIGRLRENQRDSRAMVRIRYTIPATTEVALWEEDTMNKFNQLVNGRILGASRQDDYFNAYGRSAVWRWISVSDSCRIVSLRRLLGGHPENACGNCDNCRKVSPVAAMADVSMDMIRKQNNTRMMAERVMSELEQQCLVCGHRECNGERCMKSQGMMCFNCGGHHIVAKCKTNVSKILENKACFYCYNIFCRCAKDEKHKCRLMRRLRVSIMKIYHTQFNKYENYGTFLSRIFATEATWNEFVSSVPLPKLPTMTNNQVKTIAKHVNAGNPNKRIAAFPEEKNDLNYKHMRDNENSHAANSHGDIAKTKPVTCDKKITLNKIVCEQLHDSNMLTPLLPPSYMPQSSDLGQHPDHANEIFGKNIKEVTYDDPKQAWSMYRYLATQPKSVSTHRGYVFGALYKQIFEKCHFIDTSNGPSVLRVTLSDGTQTKIWIADVAGDDMSMVTKIVQLGNKMPKSGNSRRERGDVGSLFAIGIRDAAKKVMYKSTDLVAAEIEDISKCVGPWLDEVLPFVAKNIRDAEKQKGVHNTPPMSNGPTSSIMISRDFGNASHYDVNDDSYSVGIWGEDQPGRSNNWFFIFPNIQTNKGNGVVVKLAHGRMIAWDGRVIRHCSSVPDPGEGNHVYGTVFTSCR